MKSIHIQPKNPRQQEQLEAIRTSPVTFVVGPAGVGKTYLTVNTVMNDHRRIVLTRSNEPTGRSLGAFPGTVEEKLRVWLQPMLNEMVERAGRGWVECALSKGNVVLQPIETVRGTSWDDTDILVDEAQNLTFDEILAVATRVGERSRVVFMGDPTQSDRQDSGMMKFVSIMESAGVPIPVVRYDSDDIVRSSIVRAIVKAMEKEHENNVKLVKF